jgi:hypothetical protein
MGAHEAAFITRSTLLSAMGIAGIFVSAVNRRAKLNSFPASNTGRDLRGSQSISLHSSVRIRIE